MKLKVILASVAGIAVAFVFYFLINSRSSSSSSLPLPSSQPTIATSPSPAVKLLTWKDPAGFTFKYPEGLSVNSHPEDNVNYANLEFTSPSQPGKITVLASDTKYSSLAKWLSADKTLASGAVSDLKLGDLPAKKITTDSATVIATIDDGILFTLNSLSATDSALTTTFDTIFSTFVFYVPENVAKPATETDTSAPSGDLLEETTEE